MSQTIIAVIVIVVVIILAVVVLCQSGSGRTMKYVKSRQVIHEDPSVEDDEAQSGDPLALCSTSPIVRYNGSASNRHIILNPQLYPWLNALVGNDNFYDTIEGINMTYRGNSSLPRDRNNIFIVDFTEVGTDMVVALLSFESEMRDNDGNPVYINSSAKLIREAVNNFLDSREIGAAPNVVRLQYLERRIRSVSIHYREVNVIINDSSSDYCHLTCNSLDCTLVPPLH